MTILARHHSPVDNIHRDASIMTSGRSGYSTRSTARAGCPAVPARPATDERGRRVTRAEVGRTGGFRRSKGTDSADGERVYVEALLAYAGARRTSKQGYPPPTRQLEPLTPRDHKPRGRICLAPRLLGGGDAPCPAARSRLASPPPAERHAERGQKPMHQFGT
jgi:hypothetical protein